MFVFFFFFYNSGFYLFQTSIRSPGAAVQSFFPFMTRLSYCNTESSVFTGFLVVSTVCFFGFFIAVIAAPLVHHYNEEFQLIVPANFIKSYDSVWDSAISMHLNNGGMMNVFVFDAIPQLLPNMIPYANSFAFLVQAYSYRYLLFWFNAGTTVSVSWPGMELSFYVVVTTSGSTSYDFNTIASGSSYLDLAGGSMNKTFYYECKENAFHFFFLTNKYMFTPVPGWMVVTANLTMFNKTDRLESCLNSTLCVTPTFPSGQTVLVIEPVECNDLIRGCSIDSRHFLSAMWVAVFVPVGVFIVIPWIIFTVMVIVNFFLRRSVVRQREQDKMNKFDATEKSRFFNKK
jgi:hypothetical protein